MPKRMFELVEGTSSKFWEVTLTGSQVRTRYGRIGAAGRTTAKDEGTPARAKQLHEKLVAEKTRKGYREVGGAAREAAPKKPATKATSNAKTAPAPAFDRTPYAARIAEIEAAAAQGGVKLPRGASEAALARAEAKLGVTFPPEVRAFYLAHDGGPQDDFTCGGRDLLSLKGIVSQWTVWKDLLDSGIFADATVRADEGVASTWWSPGWIPVTFDGCGNHHMLDLAPAAGGERGQIISFWHDDLPRTVEAGGFLSFLAEQRWGDEDEPDEAATYFVRDDDGDWEEGSGRKAPPSGPSVTVPGDPPDDLGGALAVGAWVRVTVGRGEGVRCGTIDRRFGRIWHVVFLGGDDAWLGSDRIAAPNDADRAYGEGEAREAKGDWKRAARAYAAATAADPTHEAAWISLCHALRQLGDAGQVLAAADGFAAHFPEAGVAATVRSIALQNLGRLDEALAAADHAIDLAPLEDGGHHQRACVLMKLGRPDDALVSVRAAFARAGDADALRGDEDLAPLRKRRELKDALQKHRLLRREIEAFRWPKALPASLEGALALLGELPLPPERFVALGAATPERLDAVERALGAALPADLRALLAVHDGVLEAWTCSGPFLAGTRALVAEQARFARELGELVASLRDDGVDPAKEGVPASPEGLLALGHDQTGHAYFVLDRRVVTRDGGAHPVARFDLEGPSFAYRFPSVAGFLAWITCEARTDPQKADTKARAFPQRSLEVVLA